MTTEDYVSFEVAKLLKEKGFDADITTYRDDFIQHGNIVIPLQECLSKDKIKTPTLQMAMKWLRENYNIHIEVRYFPMPNIYRYVIIHSPTTIENIDSHPQYFNTYEEACEEAIKCCLKILI